MLEKAKNKNFSYFLIIVTLSFCVLILPVSGITNSYNNAISIGSIGIESASYSWSEIRDASSGGTLFNTYINAGIRCDDISGKWWLMKRGVCTFNTAAIPDIGYDIISAVIYLRVEGRLSQLSGEAFYSQGFTPENPTSINIADYDTFTAGNQTKYYMDDYTGGSYYYFPIDVDLVNKEGYTCIMFRHEYDYENIEPSWITDKYDYIQLYVSECKLLVTYEEPPILPEANITPDATSGELPLDITFTDNSTGFSETYPYPTYIIYFGDGESFSGDREYTGENWFHTYENEGIYNVTYIVTQEGISYSDSTTITVTDTSTNYQVQVHGLNTAPIEGANISIWYNGAYQDSDGSSVSGIGYFDVPPYRMVNGTVTKPGYQTAYFDTYIYPDDNFEIVTLYLDNETPGSGDSYGNYIVTFKNAVTGENVGYSNIEVYSDSGYTTLFYDEYSNSGGVWTGLLPMDTVYYYKYPETIGYYSQTWSYNLTSSPAYKIVNLIPKSGATSTTTLTPTTTTTVITPTVTYTYNDSNLSALNVKERFTNLLVLAGFQNAESADLIFAMIIVLGCTALIGWITLSGSGAGMGAIIGFVFSLGLGLIPLWLLISAVFLGCLYLALKLFGETGE